MGYRSELVHRIGQEPRVRWWLQRPDGTVIDSGVEDDETAARAAATAREALGDQGPMPDITLGTHAVAITGDTVEVVPIPPDR